MQGQAGHVSPDECVRLVRASVPHIMSGSLEFFGRIFGGRIDNYHSIIDACRGDEPDEFVVTFDLGERLRVWAATGIRADAGGFEIPDAARVRWEWLSYGQPDRPENHWFIDHAVRRHDVHITSNAPVRPQHLTIPRDDVSAVKMIWFGS